MLTLGAGMMKKKMKIVFSSSFRSLERAGLQTQSMVTERALRYIIGNSSNMNSVIFLIITASKYLFFVMFCPKHFREVVSIENTT